MKNKKGFTLVELMAVIVILGVLMGVAVPNALGIYKNMKIKYFCEKVSTIEQAATLYGQDKYGEEVTTNSNEISLAKVSVLDLVKAGYIKKDDDNCQTSSSTSNCVKDPRDDSSLDRTKVEIYTKSRRIYARYIYTNTDATDKVCGDKVYKTS